MACVRHVWRRSPPCSLVSGGTFAEPTSSRAWAEYSHSPFRQRGQKVAAEIVNSRTDTDSADGAFPIDPVFALHRGGKMEVTSTVPVRDADDLSLAYTPGVAEVCTAIAES